MEKIFLTGLVILFACGAGYCQQHNGVNDDGYSKGNTSSAPQSAQQEKYRDWYKCILISGPDTIEARIKPRYEYFGKKPLDVVFNNGKERTIDPADIAELWIENPKDTIKYLSLTIEGQYRATLYRVMVEGKCLLLYSEGMRTTNVLSGGFGELAYSKLYTIYYNGEIRELRKSPEDAMYDPEPNFRKLAEEIFGECKKVSYRIASGQYSSKDIITVVKEFNHCGDDEVAK